MNKLHKIGNLYKGLHKVCRKYKVSYQKEREFNGDLHLQFRKKVAYSQSEKYNFYGIDYAECYISERDLEDRPNFLILNDLKGFLRMSFKSIRTKKPLHMSEDDDENIGI